MIRPRKKWFSENARFAFFTRYKQARSNKNIPFMIKEQFTTILVPLKRSNEHLLAECSANSRNEIRRGSREGLAFHAGRVDSTDIDYFSKFLAARSLGSANKAYMSENGSLVTSAIHNGERVASHLYLVPVDSDRARLIYSATLVRNFGADPFKSGKGEDHRAHMKMLGIANRWLHYQDLLFFRDEGLQYCDLGGLGDGAKDAKIAGINRFKRSLGGSEVTEYNYDPLLLYIMDRLL